jgi:hypothetical protein
MGWCGLDYSGLESVPVVGSDEQCTESPDSAKYWEILE